MKNSSDNNKQYTRFQVPNNFVISPKGKETKEISITPPKSCPICGIYKPDGEIKLNSPRRPQKFITVLMCKEHVKLAEKGRSAMPFYLPCITIILLLIIAPFLSLFIDFYIFFIILLIPTLICMFNFYQAFEGAFHMKFINEHIKLKYHKTSSMVIIKRLDWANEFMKLNQVSDYKLDLELIERLKKKRNQSALHLGIMATICIQGIIFSFILYRLGIIASYIIFYTIASFLYYLLMGGFVFFFVKFTYYVMKVMNLED